MANYLNDTDLYYEIVLSKGKGKLTTKAATMLQLIAKNTIRKLAIKYKGDDLHDCLQNGILKMFENWYGFDERKFKQALPYFTEIFKRGTTAGLDELQNRKPHQQSNYVKFVSLDSTNEGKGMHNF